MTTSRASAASVSVTDAKVSSRHAVPLVLVGAVFGLTWAAALRGWMIQIASSEGSESTFHWYGTFALVLLPGLVFGSLIGLAEYRRRAGGKRSWWLVLAPCVFLAALLDPTIFGLLITNGLGGGAIGIAVLALAGGHALSGRGRRWLRWLSGIFAFLGVLLMLVLASDMEPLGEPKGTWVGLSAASLLAVLMLACAIPHRIGQPSLVRAEWAAVAIGAVSGLAWSTALRAFMWEVAGREASVEWAGTFLWILLPGTVIGALLAWVEHRRWSGREPHRHWLIWSPILFAAVLVSNPLDLLGGFEDGVGISAFAVPALGIAGGFAIAGRGPLWVRGACGIAALSAIPIWSLTASDVGGSSMALANAHGAWAAVLYWGLLATLAIAAAIPHRGARSIFGSAQERLASEHAVK